MATMEVLKSDCHEPGCKARATRRVRRADGELAGDYCSKHGNSKLIELGKEEGKAKS